MERGCLSGCLSSDTRRFASLYAEEEEEVEVELGERGLNGSQAPSLRSFTRSIVG